MDCTTYVNLMLSVYKGGHAHESPYAARCSQYGVGASVHIGDHRYGFPLVKRRVGGREVSHFTTAQELRDATKGKSALLSVLEVGKRRLNWGVSHMVLMHSDRVYECTTGQPGCAVIDRTLDAFMAAHRGDRMYLFGPK